MRSRSHQIRQSLVGIFFLTLSGCANTGTSSDDSDIKNGLFDKTFRTVAVVPRHEPSTTTVKLYFLVSPRTDHARVAKGAGSGALECLEVMSGAGGDPIVGGIAALVMLGCIPIAAAVGASKASNAADTPTEPYHRAARDMSLLNGASERFEQSLKDRQPELLISQKIVSLMQARADYDVNLEPSQERAKELIRKGQMDRLLEIRLTDFGLVVDGGFNESVKDPQVTLLMIVGAITHSLSGGWVVPEKRGSMKYVGETRRFSELAAENWRLLDQEIEQGTTLLAELIVK